MSKVVLFLSFILLLVTFTARAQRTVGDEKIWLKSQVTALCSPGMDGRGYVNSGRDSAALYILKKFKKFKLQPVTPKGPFAQGFAFPINTFPGKMKSHFDGERLTPGTDYLIDPSSSSYTAEKLKIDRLNLAKVKDEAEWHQVLKTFDGSRAYLLEGVDEMCELLDLQKMYFAEDLPAGCYIIPQNDRRTWRLSRTVMPATVFYVKDENITKKLKNVSVDVTAQLLDHCHNENIIACAPGKIKDSFILISSHYDNLGMMGDSTVFPGANDNASGVAMMLSLASYFATHPQKYSILFIAFSGQTAGLMGSEYFRWNPFVPLSSIKFMLDLGMLGDAVKGIAVVNGTERPGEFDMLHDINMRAHYLPDVVKKGAAANSDHFHFAKAGVPAFFIYGLGATMYYRDLKDKPQLVTFDNANGVEKLIMDFVKLVN